MKAKQRIMTMGSENGIPADNQKNTAEQQNAKRYIEIETSQCARLCSAGCAHLNKEQVKCSLFRTYLDQSGPDFFRCQDCVFSGALSETMIRQEMETRKKAQEATNQTSKLP